MWVRVLLVVILAVVARHMFNFVKILGYEKTIYNHKPGECQFVAGVESGAEDLELLSDGIILVSSGYLTFKDRVEGAPRGHIYAYDIKDHDKGAIELKITGDYDINELHPHGIAAFEDKKSGKTLFFVISHHVGYETVDIFEFHRSTMSLSFIKSRRDPLLISVNNLVAIGPDSFYITNEARFLHPTLRSLEDVLMMRWGHVAFCDVTSCRKVSEPINNPNGIDLSRDGKYLYVDQPFSRSVLIYERDRSDNSLIGNQAVQTIPLGTLPDNVFVDESGDLWLGGIVMAHKALEHIDDHSVMVPSQVIRIRLGSKAPPHQNYALDEVYAEDGRNLSMTTSAVYHRGVLIMGTLHKRMMRCNVRAI